MKSKVKTEEFGESKPVDEDKDILIPLENDVDDLEKNIPNIEDDEENSVSAHEDLNKDSDWPEGRKVQKTDRRDHCTICGKRFKNGNEISVHYQRVHLKGNFKCPDCEFRADFADVLLSHMEENEHESHIACPYCLKKGRDCVFSKLDIASHYKRCLQRTVNCPYCELTSKTTNDMTEHKKIVHLWGEFRCNQCDFR